MLLDETFGVLVQAAAPSPGGAAVRIQQRRQYGQILSDGLPLYGEATGLRSTPPFTAGSDDRGFPAADQREVACCLRAAGVRQYRDIRWVSAVMVPWQESAGDRCASHDAGTWVAAPLILDAEIGPNEELMDPDGHGVQPVANRSKRLALLAYLALERRGRCPDPFHSLVYPAQPAARRERDPWTAAEQRSGPEVHHGPPTWRDRPADVPPVPPQSRSSFRR
jgi:hypothetical protein